MGEGQDLVLGHVLWRDAGRGHMNITEPTTSQGFGAGRMSNRQLSSQVAWDNTLEALAGCRAHRQARQSSGLHSRSKSLHMEHKTN